MVRLWELLAVPGDDLFTRFDHSAEITKVVQRPCQMQMSVREYRLLGYRPPQLLD